jgi:hypothetical protein
MNTAKIIGSLGLVLAIGVGVFTEGCGRGSNPVTAVTADSFNLKAHAVTFTAIDAKTGLIIPGSNVTFNVKGPSDVSTATGTVFTSTKVTQGAVTVYTDSTAAVTGSVSADGYLSGAATVFASRAKTIGAVPLIKLSALPTGVTSSKIGTATRVDYDIATALSYVAGSGKLAGTDSVLVFSAVSALTAAVDTISLTASGSSASVYFLAVGASDWTSKGPLVVSNGAVKIASPAAGTWAVATKLPSTTVSFGFSKSLNYDAVITLSIDGWSRSFRSGGDSSVKVAGVPTGVQVSVAASFSGKSAYFNTHTFTASETFDLNYAVTPAGASQTFIAKCVDGTVPTDLTPGFSVVVLNGSLEIGHALVGPNTVTVSGLPTTQHNYLVPTLDVLYTFVPGTAPITVQIDCPNKVLTGATGGSGTN